MYLKSKNLSLKSLSAVKFVFFTLFSSSTWTAIQEKTLVFSFIDFHVRGKRIFYEWYDVMGSLRRERSLVSRDPDFCSVGQWLKDSWFKIRYSAYCISFEATQKHILTSESKRSDAGWRSELDFLQFNLFIIIIIHYLFIQNNNYWLNFI